jgi:nucleoside-diphosphate-sugar epimerase
MKILITGGAGFVGSNLTKHFLEQGHKVTVVDNLITGQIENIEPFLKMSNFKFFSCSIESKDFTQLFNRSKSCFDQIYHLACPTGVPNIEKLGDEMLSVCSNGTLNVLNLATDIGAKFLFTSSSEVYGQPEVFPQKESYTGNVDTLGARANYEEGKRFSETLVQWFVKSRGLDGRIVRFFNVYGPNMSLNDSRVIPQFATQALTNKFLTLQGDGSQRRTFCYVSEVVEGLKLIMEKGAAGKAYNLGSDKEISMLDLANLIIEVTESASEISFVERPDHDHNSRLPDLKEVKALGWEDKVQLQEGIRRTLDYFKDQTRVNSRARQSSDKVFALPSTNPKEAYS